MRNVPQTDVTMADVQTGKLLTSSLAAIQSQSKDSILRYLEVPRCLVPVKTPAYFLGLLPDLESNNTNVASTQLLH